MKEKILSIEKPILFTGEMVNAILENRKTVTRRLVDPQPPYYIDYFQYFEKVNYFGAYTMPGNPCAYPGIKAKYWPGLKLWVRETWGITGFWYSPSIGKHDPIYYLSVKYRANNFENESIRVDKKTWDKYYNKAMWETSTRKKMELVLKWQPSIFTLRPVSRINLKITDVKIERLHEIDDVDAILEGKKNREDYARLWDKINGKTGHKWESNPWVYRIQFERLPDA
jgi:hypothetical protein